MNARNQRSKFPLALIALLISAFAIGTTEFVIMGILPDVAADLHVTFLVTLISWSLDQRETEFSAPVEQSPSLSIK